MSRIQVNYGNVRPAVAASDFDLKMMAAMQPQRQLTVFSAPKVAASGMTPSDTVKPPGE